MICSISILHFGHVKYSGLRVTLMASISSRSDRGYLSGRTLGVREGVKQFADIFQRA